MNLAYPGASYNIGSMFRERDMGNLIQLIFVCGDYFRYKNVELVCDSHFDHIVPIAFLRLWKIFSTCSFSAMSRIGTKHLPELSKTKLSKEDLQALVEATDEKINVAARPERDVFESDLEVDEYTEYDEKKMRKKFGRVKSRIQFFEKKLSMKKKGTFKVWETELFLLENLKIKIYLHAVLDSKVLYRVSNRTEHHPLLQWTSLSKIQTERKRKKFPYGFQRPSKFSECEWATTIRAMPNELGLDYHQSIINDGHKSYWQSL